MSVDRRRLRYAIAAAALIVVLSWAFVTPVTHGQTLPPGVASFLDQRFPGWKFATVVESLRARFSAEYSAAWIEGDYDGDGQKDYAVQIVVGGASDRQQIVLVLLRRPDGYELHTLKSFPVQDASYLHTSPKGAETMDVENDTKIVNRTDVIDLLYGEEAGETFFYENGRFRGVISGD